MPIIFDTSPLLRPRFTEAEFAATKWHTAHEKADFANKLCTFIAADFKESLFTKRLYKQLHLTFVHIACYNREGFFGTFFRDLSGKVEFLELTLQWPSYGDASSTYCDVERAVQQRVRRCDLLTIYRALRAAEIERRERETLQRLSAKYAGDAESKKVPVMITAPGPRTVRPRSANRDQTSLF